MEQDRSYPLVGARTALESALGRLPRERQATLIHLVFSPLWFLGWLEELGLLLLALPVVAGGLMWRIEGRVGLAILIATVPYVLWIGLARRLTDWQSGRQEHGEDLLRELEEAQRLCWEGGVETLAGREFRSMRLSEIERAARAALSDLNRRTGG